MIIYGTFSTFPSTEVNDMTGAMDDMIYDGTVIMPNLPQYALDIIRQEQAAAA